jgi:hypothetical protein
MSMETTDAPLAVTASDDGPRAANPSTPGGPDPTGRHIKATPPEDRAEAAPSWGILTAHAAQLSALGIGLFLLMKTYSVARYSLTTASALLTAAPVAVILGTLTSYEYELWPLLSLAAGALAGRLWTREGLSVAFLLTAGLSLACALLSPPVYLLAALIGIAAVCVAHEAVRRSLARARADGLPSWFPTRYAAIRTAFVAVTVAALIVSLPNAWLPAEIVVFHGADGQRRVVVGHVVSDDAGWVTILRGGDHGLTRLRAEQVTTRRVCHLGGAQPHARRPLALVLTRSPYASPNVGCRTLLAALPPATVIGGSFPASAPYPVP